MDVHAIGEPHVDPAAVDAVLTVSRSMVSVAPAHHRVPRRLLRVLTAAGAVAAAITITACGLEQPPASAGTQATQTAATVPGATGTTVQVGRAMDVINARIPAPPAGAATAQVEMTLADVNTTWPDVLRAASSRAAAAIVFTIGGQAVPRIVIPVASGSSISTGPLHPDRILLTGLRHPLRTGQTVTISLTFALAGHATIHVPVIPRAR
jgi:copper(I)-binding protein